MFFFWKLYCCPSSIFDFWWLPLWCIRTKLNIYIFQRNIIQRKKNQYLFKKRFSYNNRKTHLWHIGTFIFCCWFRFKGLPYSGLFSRGFYFRLFSRSNVNRQNKFREIFIQNLYFQFRFGNVSSIYAEQIYNGRWSLINIVETCLTALCVNFHNWFSVLLFYRSKYLVVSLNAQDEHL